MCRLKKFVQQSERQHSDDQLSWKIIVDSWGRTMELKQQIALINELAFLDFKV